MNSTITGLAGKYNDHATECLQLLDAAEGGVMSGDQAAERTGGSGVRVVESEKQRNARAQACASAISHISSLANERRAMLDTGAGGGYDDAADREAMARRRQEDAERQKREMMAAVAAEQRKLRNSKSANGRVQARLLLLRHDDVARQQLEEKCAAWKVERSDGRLEQRNFIGENRRSIHTLSTESLLASRVRSKGPCPTRPPARNPLCWLPSALALTARCPCA
jgi:hypothetical protein